MIITIMDQGGVCSPNSV